MEGASVVNAGRDDQQRSIATLVTAFVADPAIRWMLPEPQQYLRGFPEILRYFAAGAFEHDSAYRSQDFKAAACWLPPGVGPDEEALGRVLEEVVAPTLQGDVFAVLEQVGAAHPEAAHWYLPAIGVDPMCQGLGYGSALLTRGLAVCDRDHIAAYLEASNPKSIPLYQRFGFEIVGRIQAGSSPAITPMLRAAR